MLDKLYNKLKWPVLNTIVIAVIVWNVVMAIPLVADTSLCDGVSMSASDGCYHSGKTRTELDGLQHYLPDQGIGFPGGYNLAQQRESNLRKAKILLGIAAVALIGYSIAGAIWISDRRRKRVPMQFDDQGGRIS